MADALSRVGVSAVSAGSPVTDFKAMADAQAADQDLQRIRASPSTSLKLQAVPLAMSDNTILCDVSTGVSRPFVPMEFVLVD